MKKIVKVTTIKDIDLGKMKAFKVEGKEIAIANVEGEFIAFDDTCTHAYCSLAGSYLEGNTITCYCHGAQFDIKSGDVISGPAQIPLKTYQVQIKGDDLYIEF